jgi:hypothetical protein
MKIIEESLSTIKDLKYSLFLWIYEEFSLGVVFSIEVIAKASHIERFCKFKAILLSRYLILESA